MSQKRLDNKSQTVYKFVNLYIYKDKMDNIFKLHAEICKTMANPKRLEILNFLRDREANATEIMQNVKMSKANLSQHMGVLTQKGVVTARKEGINVFYKISDKRIIKACDLMREVLIKVLEDETKFISNLKSIRR